MVSLIVPAVVLKDSASIRLYASLLGAGGTVVVGDVVVVVVGGAVVVVGGTVVVGTVFGGTVVGRTVVVVAGAGAVNESQFKLVKSAG